MFITASRCPDIVVHYMHCPNRTQDNVLVKMTNQQILQNFRRNAQRADRTTSYFARRPNLIKKKGGSKCAPALVLSQPNSHSSFFVFRQIGFIFSSECRDINTKPVCSHLQINDFVMNKPNKVIFRPLEALWRFRNFLALIQSSLEAL